jgi:hypothetical protein
MRYEIEKQINKILEGGTKIVSFDYAGKRRNVLVGASDCAYQGPWGNQENRAIRSNGGKLYLVARVNNDKAAAIKCFDLDKIENPSPALA